MNDIEKPIILTFIGHYLPGHKAGGILRITVNTIDHLSDEYEFKIVTRDRDLGDNKPYPEIKVNQWQKVDNADVFYLPPRHVSLKYISNLIKNTPHHVLYLNSFFDPLTINVLLNRKLNGGRSKPVIVVPWGEFGWASLKQKYLKKFLFVQVAKLFGLYRNITWRASSGIERTDIIKVMNAEPEAVHITGDLPIKKAHGRPLEGGSGDPDQSDGLKLIFLSRISREKNLDYALKILRKVKSKIIFDIYGPDENKVYWKECQDLIKQLPGHVTVNYLGRVDADQVVQVFGRYDLFLFPTGGEAYGHVIAECLTSGTPVLISTETPWRNLSAAGLGFDIDLKHEDRFVETIEKLAVMDRDERSRIRAVIKKNIVERLFDPTILKTNRRLFQKQL